MFVQHQTVHIFRVDSEKEIVSHIFSPSWPEQAARVQRVLRLQGNHLQPAAILNETNCKYKMSRPEATLHLY